MVGQQNADTVDTQHLRDVAIAYGLSMGYNFGCMIASNRLFDSRGGFLGASYHNMTTQLISRL